MKNIRLIFLIASGLIIGCMDAWGEKASAKITVETAEHTQTIDVYESGKMYFSGDFLVFETSDNAESKQNPVKFDLKEIKKLLFSPGDASKVDDALYVSSFNVSPNPAKDFITLQLPFDEERPYSIYDMSGNIVKSGSISNGEKLNVESLPSGMYLMNIGNMYIKFNKL
ncbi:MAG: T9SS type A sorting domain-containing protein [Paludibacteraceae bacterium]|nr:T9SS type A sorting domain-containing protein [Paludibacteraceae bacterium]